MRFALPTLLIVLASTLSIAAEPVESVLVNDPPAWVVRLFTRSDALRQDCLDAFQAKRTVAEKHRDAAKVGKINGKLKESQLVKMSGPGDPRFAPLNRPAGKFVYTFPSAQEKKQTIAKWTDEARDASLKVDQIKAGKAWPILWFDWENEPLGKIELPELDDVGTFSRASKISRIYEDGSALIEIERFEARDATTIGKLRSLFIAVSGVDMQGRADGQSLHLGELGDGLYRVKGTRKDGGNTLIEISPIGADELMRHLPAGHVLVRRP